MIFSYIVGWSRKRRKISFVLFPPDRRLILRRKRSGSDFVEPKPPVAESLKKPRERTFYLLKVEILRINIIIPVFIF